MSPEESKALIDLTDEGVLHLREAFGPVTVQSRWQEGDGDDFIVRVVALLPPDYHGDPEAALKRFDEEWWIDNCHRSNDNLVFDYEVSS